MNGERLGLIALHPPRAVVEGLSHEDAPHAAAVCGVTQGLTHELTGGLCVDHLSLAS